MEMLASLDYPLLDSILVKNNLKQSFDHFKGLYHAS